VKAQTLLPVCCLSLFDGMSKDHACHISSLHTKKYCRCCTAALQCPDSPVLSTKKRTAVLVTLECSDHQKSITPPVADTDTDTGRAQEQGTQ
jgi:hypothetical protein